jgi:hypothetical protein
MSMKNNKWLLPVITSFFLVGSCTLFNSKKELQLQHVPSEIAGNYAKTITQEDLYKHLSILASDEYEGRETAMKGQKMAAAYIQNHFQQIGLLPGNGHSYLQSFPVVVKDPKKVTFSLNGDSLSFLNDFYYLGNIADTLLENISFVYLGYGVDQEGVSDYVGQDVAGKIVVITEGIPSSGVDFVWTNWRKKLEAAATHGAVAVLTLQDRYATQVKVIKEYVENPRMSLHNKGNKPNNQLPNIYMEPSTFVKYAGNLPQEKGHIDGIKAKLDFRTSQILQSENVLGFLEGSDLKHEILVITAHYDHIGFDNGEVCNGADDDGSGTVALLELAEAFSMAKKAGYGPRRSILFMTVSGEEKGLLGSDYYTQFPVYPLENTIANLNIDMIGRKDSLHTTDKYVYLIGTDRISKDLHEISEQTNKKTVNLQLDYTYNRPNDPNMFYYRSDHYNFAKNNIPVIFYFSGVHEDYHKPTDDVEKILFEKYTTITQLIFYTAWELVNRNERPRKNA